MRAILLLTLSLILSACCNCPDADQPGTSKHQIRQEQVQSFLERMMVAVATNEDTTPYFTDKARVVLYQKSDDGEVDIRRTEPDSLVKTMKRIGAEVDEYEFEILDLTVAQTQPGWDVSYTLEERFAKGGEDKFLTSNVDLELIHSRAGAKIGRMVIHQ